ncbi:DUF5695 domain-containing protein [Parapedobacter pyrenivorans]|nr:DUF5695 domain-containing protein [Parapedobacter pyrenivorans]
MKQLKYMLSLVVLMQMKVLMGFAQERQQFRLENEKMEVIISRSGISSIKSPSDSYGAEIVGSNSWGRANLTYRIWDGSWLAIHRGSSTNFAVLSDSVVRITDYEKGMPQQMEQTFTLVDDGLDLDIRVKSMMQFPFEVGDLSLDLRPHGPRSEQSKEGIFQKSFIKHQYISGHGSFIFYAKPSGNGPFLMVLPKAGTSLEYFDNQGGGERVYIHSKLPGSLQQQGTWRQEHTSVSLNPAGETDSEVEYGFKLRWVDGYDEMRDLLFKEGLFDIRVVPGMTIPTDLRAQFSLRTKHNIDSISAEFPTHTELRFVEEVTPGNYIYEVQFSKLGENMLIIHYGDGYQTYLEFFATEPLETLIKKRSSFIVNHQQHRDTSKWYNGLYSIYDMKNGILRSPDDTDGFEGWWSYVVASDDPVLGKAPYVAAKNVYYPDDTEIASVEYHIKNFVWGGLQRTDEETPYPYGIHGVPNWKVARDINARTAFRARQLDRMQVWRTYDYPHVFMLYYHMYEIASKYPDKVQYLDAAGYLERTFQTAKAYFMYPYEIWGDYYKIYEVACYNELLIPDIIHALERHGRGDDAEWLRNEYEKKVKYFIYDDEYPYSSEYSFDRTAFESTYAFAKYGMITEMEPDSNLWFDKNREIWYSHANVSKQAAKHFMERQHGAGLSIRGWLETNYYKLGADNSMSYMAKMGGWSVLDYGINFAEKPYDWLQLGYASYLSSWALMNTGTPESNYGFWAPGKENDGAMGWAFIEQKRGRSWLGRDMDRGPWYYDGEADLGLGAGIRMAATVVSNDPIFGWVAYGGNIREEKENLYVVPKDGLNARFVYVLADKRVTYELDRDGFLKDAEIITDKNNNSISFVVENRSQDVHLTTLKISAIFNDIKHVQVAFDGKPLNATRRDGSHFFEIQLPMQQASHHVEIKLGYEADLAR